MEKPIKQRFAVEIEIPEHYRVTADAIKEMIEDDVPMECSVTVTEEQPR